MADRQVINTSGSADDANAGAMTALLAILVIAVIAFGIWFTARHSSSAVPGTPNTGVPLPATNPSGAGAGTTNPSAGSGNANNVATPQSP